MAIVTTDNANYGDIAAAIREKAGGTALYKPTEMAAAIRAIQTGGGSGGSVFCTEVTVAEDTYTLQLTHGLGKIPNRVLVALGCNYTKKRSNTIFIYSDNSISHRALMNTTTTPGTANYFAGVDASWPINKSGGFVNADTKTITITVPSATMCFAASNTYMVICEVHE